jgi:hypothetical protein
MIFYSQTTELGGGLTRQTMSFAGAMVVMDGAYVNDIATMDLATSDHFRVPQASNLGSIRELINRGRATYKCNLCDVGHIHHTSSAGWLPLKETNVMGQKKS